MPIRYKNGSDTNLIIEFKDKEGNDILLSSLAAYGIEIFNPKGESVGKWGTCSGYTSPTGKFDVYGAASCELKLSATDYRRRTGEFCAELLLQYADTDFDDSLRDLYSDRKIVFQIEDFVKAASLKVEASSVEISFNVLAGGSISQVYATGQDTPQDAYDNTNIKENQIFFLTGESPGIYGPHFENFLFIKKTV